MDWSVVNERMQEMLNSLMRLLPGLVLGMIVFGLFAVLSVGVRALVQRLIRRQKRHLSLALAMGRLMQWTMLLFGLLIAAAITFPTFTPARLISSLGLAGIAVGFAFKDIFENFIAGILILLTEPFRVNDQIVYGAYEGTVEDIHTRATAIRTYDGRRILIPNAELYTNPVTINTAFDVRRLQYDVGIGYGDDIRQARDLMLASMRSVEGVLDDPAPDVVLADLAESSVILRLRWWIRPPRRADALDTQDRVLTAVKETLTANGIDLPFPTQQILFHEQTEETDGDRTRQREGWPAGDGHAPRPHSIAGALGSLAAQAEGNSREGDGQAR